MKYYFQILLHNKNTNISYLIDTFLEETISSQDNVFQQVEYYRELFKWVDVQEFIIKFQKVEESEDDTHSTTVYKVDDIDIFIWTMDCKNQSWVVEEKKSIKVLEDHEFKI